MVRKQRPGKAVIRTNRYDLYIATGDVYTKDHTYFKHLESALVDYLVANRGDFARMKGKLYLDSIIKNSDTFEIPHPDVEELDRMISEIIENIPE